MILRYFSFWQRTDAFICIAAGSGATPMVRSGRAIVDESQPLWLCPSHHCVYILTYRKQQKWHQIQASFTDCKPGPLHLLWTQTEPGDTLHLREGVLGRRGCVLSAISITRASLSVCAQQLPFHSLLPHIIELVIYIHHTPQTTHRFTFRLV